MKVANIDSKTARTVSHEPMIILHKINSNHALFKHKFGTI